MASNTVSTVTDEQAMKLRQAISVAAENNPNGLAPEHIEGALLDNFHVQSIEAIPAEKYENAEAYIALAGMKDGGDRNDPAVARLWELITGEDAEAPLAKQDRTPNEQAIAKAVEDVQEALAGLQAYREAVKRLSHAAEGLAWSVVNRLNLAGCGHGRDIAESMVTGRLENIVSSLYKIQSAMTQECHNLTVLAKTVDRE